jgi:hypothetical protein
MAQTLEIRPRPDQFKEAILWVLEKADIEAIEVHMEGVPPWFRIETKQGQSIVAEMQRRGVEVRRPGVPTDVPLS